jgi:hypothetical protein
MCDTTERDADAGSGPRGSGDAAPFGLDAGPDAGDDGFALRSHVQEYDDAPDECTIFPRRPSEDLPRTTAWLTAREGAFCPLDENR